MTLVDEIIKKYRPKDEIFIRNQNITTNSQLKQLNHLIKSINYIININFENTFIIGSNISIPFLNNIANKRLQLKNLLFTAFSSVIFDRIKSDVHIENLKLFNSTFESIQYINSFHINSVVKITNISIQNCNFYDSAFFGLSACNLELKNFSIQNCIYTDSYLIFSVDQTIKISNFSLTDSIIEHSNLFYINGHTLEISSLLITDSLINNIIGNDSILIRADFFVKIEVSELSMTNSTNLSLFSGPTTSISMKNIAFSHCSFDSISIFNKLGHTIDLSSFIVSDTKFGNHAASINSSYSVFIENINFSNLENSKSLMRIHSPQCKINNVTSINTSSSSISLIESKSQMKNANFQNSDSCILLTNSSLQLSDSEFNNIKNLSIIADNSSLANISDSCRFNDAFAINTTGISYISDKSIGNNSGYIIGSKSMFSYSISQNSSFNLLIPIVLLCWMITIFILILRRLSHVSEYQKLPFSA